MISQSQPNKARVFAFRFSSARLPGTKAEYIKQRMTLYETKVNSKPKFRKMYYNRLSRQKSRISHRDVPKIRKMKIFFCLRYTCKSMYIDRFNQGQVQYN